jgi:hypothetical protein
MTTNYIPYLIGLIVGLGLWYNNISTMEGVMERPDENGNQISTPANILEYAKLPFNKDKLDIAWATVPDISVKDRVNLLGLNWVVVAGVSTVVTTVTIASVKCLIN